MVRYFCVSCHSLKSAKDPHLQCPDCRPLCDSEHRCQECCHLSVDDFAKYIFVVNKRASQKQRRMSSNASASAPDASNDPDVTNAQPEDSSTTVQRPPPASSAPAVSFDDMKSFFASLIEQQDKKYDQREQQRRLEDERLRAQLQQRLDDIQRSDSSPRRHDVQRQTDAQHDAQRQNDAQRSSDSQRRDGDRRRDHDHRRDSAHHRVDDHRRRSSSRQSDRSRRSRSPASPHRTEKSTSPHRSRSPLTRSSRSRSPRRHSSQPQRQSRSPQRRSAPTSDARYRRRRSPSPRVSATVSKAPASTIVLDSADEANFNPDYTEEQEETLPALSMDQVHMWVADRLVDCPSPSSSAPDNSKLRADPDLQFPLHPAIREVVDQLDEDFSKLSLNPTVKAARFRKSDYPIHSADFLLAGATQDEHMQRLSKSSHSSYSITDARLRSVDQELRRAMVTISSLMSVKDAMFQDLKEENSDRIEHFHTVLSYQAKVLGDLTDHVRTALATTTVSRRVGLLSDCAFQEEFKKRLVRAPVSTPTIFAGKIPEVHKEFSEITMAETQLQTFQAIAKLPQKLAGRSGTYQPRRRSSRGSSSAPRGRPSYTQRRPTTQPTQHQPVRRPRDQPRQSRGGRRQ